MFINLRVSVVYSPEHVRPSDTAWYIKQLQTINDTNVLGSFRTIISDIAPQNYKLR